jgi:hypothetical protein
MAKLWQRVLLRVKWCFIKREPFRKRLYSKVTGARWTVLPGLRRTIPCGWWTKGTGQHLAGAIRPNRTNRYCGVDHFLAELLPEGKVAAIETF